jgi:hypothetical protein
MVDNNSGIVPGEISYEESKDIDIRENNNSY